MPKLLEKHKVLDGRAEILRYENYPDVWYYREKRSKERAYKTRKISKVKSKKQAIKAAIDIYAELRNEEDKSYDIRNTPATINSMVFLLIANVTPILFEQIIIFIHFVINSTTEPSNILTLIF